jgi:hypothetical protein
MAAGGPGHLCDRKDIQGRQVQIAGYSFVALVAEALERTCNLYGPEVAEAMAATKWA